jgi:hypothetical protein
VVERAGVRLGDVLIADQIIDPEQQKLTEEGSEIRWSPHRVEPTLSAAAMQLKHFHFYSAQAGVAKYVFSWGKAA